MLKYFHQLLGGVSEQDLNFVLNLESLAGSVRMYSDETRELHPVAEMLPRPVKFTLVRYHHKHAFENRGPPGRSVFLQRLTSLEQTLKWMAALGNNDPEGIT